MQIKKLNRVIAFYFDLLGLSVTKIWSDGVILDTFQGMLEFFCNGESTRVLGAIRHFAFEVSDTVERTDKVR